MIKYLNVTNLNVFNFTEMNVRNEYMNSILLLSLLMMGCTQHVAIPANSPCPVGVTETLPIKTQPAQFYFCGDSARPCKAITNRWQTRAKSRPMTNRSVTH
jgi:hypothetical protein